MKKLMIIIPAMIFILIPIVWSLEDLCQYGMQSGNPCIFVTPPLNCTKYNYTIYTMSQLKLEQEPLHVYSGQLFYWNFSTNISKGYYILSLCDGTQREFKVSDPKMTYIADVPKVFSFGFDVSTVAGVLFITLLIAIFIALLITSIFMRRLLVLGGINALYGFILGIIISLSTSLILGVLIGFMAIGQLLIIIYKLRHDEY